MKINKKYQEICENILNEEHFMSLKNDIHHGTNRYDHSKRVAHLSYLLTKLFKGNTVVATRAGLLHDFFNGSAKDNVELSYLNHPLVSVQNAKKYFNISLEEENIIKSHMYHYALTQKITRLKSNNVENVYTPTSKEGKIVCFADLLVSLYEGVVFEGRYATALYFVFLINLIRY